MSENPSPRSWVDYAAQLGQNLRDARRSAGMTQKQVAHAAGIATFTYQKLEKGESNPGAPANPGLQTVVALAVVLGARLDDLLPTLHADLAVARPERDS